MYIYTVQYIECCSLINIAIKISCLCMYFSISIGWRGVHVGANGVSIQQFIKTANIIPNYTRDHIVHLAMGSYGYNLASRYIAHGFNTCQAQCNNANAPNCIRFRNIVGRFTSTKIKTPKKYSICLDFNGINNNVNNNDNNNNNSNNNNNNNNNNDNDINFANNPIGNIGWYCTCKSGNRMSNPCAHCIAVLRYCQLIKTDALNTIQNK